MTNMYNLLKNLCLFNSLDSRPQHYILFHLSQSSLSLLFRDTGMGHITLTCMDVCPREWKAHWKTYRAKNPGEDFSQVVIILKTDRAKRIDWTFSISPDPKRWDPEKRRVLFVHCEVVTQPRQAGFRHENRYLWFRLYRFHQSRFQTMILVRYSIDRIRIWLWSATFEIFWTTYSGRSRRKVPKKINTRNSCSCISNYNCALFLKLLRANKIFYHPFLIQRRAYRGQTLIRKRLKQLFSTFSKPMWFIKF